MSVLNKNYKQVVNLAGQVSELNTSELECGTLKTSSLLANSIRPRLPNGEIKTIYYTATIPPDGTYYSFTLTTEDGKPADELSTQDIILSVTLKSTGGNFGTGPYPTIDLKIGSVAIISLPSTPVVDTIVNNTGGVLGQKVTNYTGGNLSISHPGITDYVTVSGKITYFEPN